MAEFDTIAKDLIHAYPADFARLALQRDDVEVLEVLDTEQPTVETHRTDSLIRVRLADGQEVLVHHEFQTTDSNPPMPYRIVGYTGHAVEHHHRPVYSCVIYLRPDAGRNDPGYYRQQLEGRRLLVEYQVIRLSELDGQRILAGEHPGLIPFTPLMQRPADVDAEAWLRQCVNRAQQVPMDRTHKANYLTDLALLSGLVYKSETVMTIIREATMYESSVARYLEERGVKRGIEQGREEGIAQGLEQGIEQGLEQGIERGLAQGIEREAQESLLEVLALRFQPEDMNPLANRIEAIGDVQRLKQLRRAAIQTATLDDFRRLLDAE